MTSKFGYTVTYGGKIKEAFGCEVLTLEQAYEVSKQRVCENLASLVTNNAKRQVSIEKFNSTWFGKFRFWWSTSTTTEAALNRLNDEMQTFLQTEQDDIESAKANIETFSDQMVGFINNVSNVEKVYVVDASEFKLIEVQLGSFTHNVIPSNQTILVDAVIDNKKRSVRFSRIDDSEHIAGVKTGIYGLEAFMFKDHAEFHLENLISDMVDLIGANKLRKVLNN